MKLMNHLPTNQYKSEPHVQNLQDALGSEVTKADETVNNFMLQLNPITATWGLAFFEKDYGIKTDNKKTIEQRRELLLAKMKGKGTSTVALIKEVASSFSNGEVIIDEYFDDYGFGLVFTSHIGVPEKINDLLHIIDEIKPAHLAMSYQEIYNTHNYLAQFTHDFLAGFTYKELRTKELKKEWEKWRKIHQ